MIPEALNVFARAFQPPAALAGPGGALAIPSLTGAADAFLARTLATDNVTLAVTPGIPDADRLMDDLTLLDDARVRLLEYPVVPDDDKTALGLKLKTVAALRSWAIAPYPAIVVAPVAALDAAVPRAGMRPIEAACGQASPGFSPLCAALAKAGYTRVATVEREGDFAVRGDIVDAWGLGDVSPTRLEFFGDEIESIRAFDAATQISRESLARASFMPCRSDAPGDTARQTILDLLPDGATILALEHNSYSLNLPGAQRFRLVYTGDPAPGGVATYRFQTIPLPGFTELGAGEAHHPELFDAARARLEKHLAEAKACGDLIVQLDDLSGGFELPGLVVVTKADRVFSKRHVTRRTRPAAQGVRLNDFEDMEPGEYVVHVDYGVGLFRGSSEIQVGGKTEEVFTIEYEGGALLHIPPAHAHLVSRYVGVKGEAVKLHRLDGKRWARDKASASKAIADLAAALLETQARRETVPGFAYDVACEGLDAFEAAFPYEETPDQAAAIEDVKRDLASRRPMDRLICGDAGYGKTEVAMRAAFIAAMNGKQVAVLAPTTVLAEQHFETFTARFDGTPLHIEAVSRFQTPAARENTFKRLAAGICDIAIGTHAILSDRLAFHDLGLIIIDEEQRFGVRHKEALKQLRATADVLTLSATPIPRTLYMSMTGARELSILRTPPRERVAVDTRIVRDSDELVRAAIESELARGGQVFFLHNRVATIEIVAKRLRRLCPRARLTVAHGRMDAKTLARKIHDFERAKSDILLSTTIVESGIDIPRANTILVDQAERFGLADLYQLRGRVGRSSRQGHAIFLLPASGHVDADARERLTALQRHGGLGAGFHLAVRDLELRGAGNLLGRQQSGHIAAVGFNLYCQLLKRTIASLKGEKLNEIIDVKLNLDFIDAAPGDPGSASAAALPYAYIEEDVHRLGLLRRFAEAPDVRAVNALAREMQDRFGKMPDAARRFVDVVRLKVQCAARRVERIDAKNGRAVFYKVGEKQIAHVAMLSGATSDKLLASLGKALREHFTKQG